MQVYRFAEEDTGRFALTGDMSGRRLPRLGCVWRFAGSFDIDHAAPPDLGATSVDVREAILKNGFFLWPDDVRLREVCSS